MAQRLSEDCREKIEAAVRQSRGLRAERLPVGRDDLLRAYLGDVAEEDLLGGDAAYLANVALSHLSWAASRAPKTAKVRVFNPDRERDGWHSNYTVVQTVNDDMPFLVDSLTLCLSERGYGIHATLHPRLNVDRTRAGRLKGLGPVQRNDPRGSESFIYIEINKELDAGDLNGLREALESTLRDVRVTVEDWQPMLAALRASCAAVRDQASRQTGMLEESTALLNWLADDHFTLLGLREYRLRRGGRTDRLLPIRGSGLGILRETPKVRAPSIEVVGAARRELRSRNPLVITKSLRRSSVHRSGYLDQINVKVFDERGRPKGERRILGLFTSVSYSADMQHIPLVRLKVSEVMRRSGIEPKSHRGKALQHILDTFPRDDLFQISIGDLTRISLGVLNLQDRHQVRLFCRRDILSRFYSCFLYLPKDHYSAQARRRIEKILLEEFRGSSIDTRVTISESLLARLEATIRVPPTLRTAPRLADLQAKLVKAVETWSDQLRAALLERLDEVAALDLYRRFSAAFPASYQAETGPAQASADVSKLAALLDAGRTLDLSLVRSADGDEPRLRFTIFRRGDAVPLYTFVPILERMGMLVLSENLHRVEIPDGPACWIQVFELAPSASLYFDAEELEPRVRDCFAAVLDGRAENDRFNSFVALAGLSWREASLLRAYCKFLLQTGISFSQLYMQQVLARHAEFAHALIALFHARFDPDLENHARHEIEQSSKRTISATLESVTNLDDDRILRAFLGVFEATLRTNFYLDDGGEPKPSIAFKLDPKRVVELPKPRPMFEIFVYAPRVEGVHLRCGRIARGGLRWSDRREDFRTEILGLMKAQNVKNTVIVPDGAKGGFVCKQLPENDPDALRAEVVECYEIFVRALLDLTDNVVVDRVVHPDRVRYRDGDDPYLVVAADKGTATFSDLANGISAEHGFWLGDAFASGGSTGYDHKKMGITARGAWEAVKRHFREIGIDPERESFTVIGIGDMSGDVFGNGMQMSRHLKLLAAFNHLHIFLDPDPDPNASYAERARLYAMPRSSWEDYTRGKLSTGGGVFSRRAKAVQLHPAAQKLLRIDKASLTPPELIKAILRLRVDLLWNGGIGTYVKAGTESHADVGDPSNDAVRINANELACKVVAEGGNLGLTQPGRIEFALRGGHINTDFIDNSGGVDCSDREVNIKILLNQALESKRLSRSKRNRLLAEMTEEVAELVLEDNYAQIQILSMMSTRSVERLGENMRLMRELESGGLLDRALEHLPSDDAITDRQKSGKGLTRPELAVVLSYSKLALIEQIMETDLPEDPYLDDELGRYFPATLRKRFSTAMRSHRLSRELVGMRIAGGIINHMGASFAFRAMEDTGSSVAQVVRAYAITRDLFEVRPMWAAVEAADGRIPTESQYDLMFEISRMMRRAVYWFLKRYPNELEIEPMVAKWKPGVSVLMKGIMKLESPPGERRLRRQMQQLTEIGVDARLAHQMVALTALTQSLEIIEVARDHELEVAETARLYFELARGLKLDRIRQAIEELEVEGRWRAIARATLRENLAQQQSAVLRKVLANRGRHTPREALGAWLVETKDEIHRVRQILEDMEASGGLDFATLSVAIREVERLT
jgi:glutamate dehydrogenase